MTRGTVDILTTDPDLYRCAKQLTSKYGRGRAACKLAKVFAGLRTPNGDHYSISNIKEALEEL